jgi:hypothetical protein
MKTQVDTDSKSVVARSLAPEDVRCGDFVSILYEIVELPSYLWDCDSQLLPPAEPVRMQWRGTGGGTPLKVKAVCLPFVFVKLPCGKHGTLDVRQHQLVRLSPAYARPVWKALSKQAAAARGLAI